MRCGPRLSAIRRHLAAALLVVGVTLMWAGVLLAASEQTREG